MTTRYYPFTGSVLNDTAPATTLVNLSTSFGTSTDFPYTHASAPGTTGITGDYTVNVFVWSGQVDARMSVAVARVNSSGTVQQTSSFSSELVAGTNLQSRNFTLTGIDLGTWASGDRLQVIVRVRSVATMGSTTIQIAYGTSTYVDAPWDTAGSALDSAYWGVKSV